MTKDSLEPITWKGTDLDSGRMMRFTFALIALLALALGASAAPITWTLSGVTLDGGAISVSGSSVWPVPAPIPKGFR